MVGKYVDLTESYKSLIEALKHAGIHTETDVQITFVDSESIEKGNGDVPCSKTWTQFWCRAASVHAA